MGKLFINPWNFPSLGLFMRLIFGNKLKEISYGLNLMIPWLAFFHHLMASQLTVKRRNPSIDFLSYSSFSFLSSFFLVVLTFLWIGAQFPQEKFLSYGRILTLYYYFL